ncbi:hypothetical protein MYSTI_03671 [Myxococcus stipitatus DSM 14675]|uniref:Urease accessory protein UreH-like transmembrane domain-containing protein n=1 Tax=Myxococcus stipitatus (strain DSM 14675 / JCM 12634 / Mx s8) TaxID=1278073 RepID=L7UBN1_MYXSD|nr:hypothetical protein [Myxococcus stipitatus]AGC44977.1 hypothetical protein MYSTI_03671 [Myxococcus stipitatus DSM 14675]
MPLIALAGVGSGALHALAGPDHLLSLAPLSVGRRQGAWWVGLMWGLGHGLGTLLAAGALLVLLSAVHLEFVDRWAERVAGLALLGMGVWGLTRRQAVAGEAQPPRGVAAVGLVHGLTGASALLLLLPVTVSGTALEQALFLGGFSVGSTLAMSALTAGIAAVSRARRLSTKVAAHVTRGASSLSILLGGVWMAGSF